MYRISIVIALFTIIRMYRDKLLTYYRHKYISCQVRTIMRKAIIYRFGMGYKLKKREYDYNENLFKEIGIQVQEVEGRNFLEISNIIAKNYRKLSIKCHLDKPGGSNEKIQVLNRNKAALLQYIKPLSEKNKGIIIPEEMRRCSQLIKQGQNDKRAKYYLVFSFVSFLSGISSLVSYIYLGFKLYKAANFTDISGILFSASLITFVILV